MINGLDIFYVKANKGSGLKIVENKGDGLKLVKGRGCNIKSNWKRIKKIKIVYMNDYKTMTKLFENDQDEIGFMLFKESNIIK